jgi:hypothetical protein
MKLGLMVFEIDEVKGYRVKNIPSLRDTKVSNLCFELWWSSSVTVFLTIQPQIDSLHAVSVSSATLLYSTPL